MDENKYQRHAVYITQAAEMVSNIFRDVLQGIENI